MERHEASFLLRCCPKTIGRTGHARIKRPVDSNDTSKTGEIYRLSDEDMTHWLSKYWVQGALFMAVALLALVPLIFKAWWPQILLIYLHSPGYMVHQVEEHTGDRFRTFINQRLFGGVEALTTVGVLWINLPGVWGINLAALYAAVFLEPGYALAAPYLMIVNAVAHLGTVKRTHGYNPGLVTALIVFFPLGLVTLYMVPASLGQHLLGLGISIAIHATIAGGAITRAAYLRRAQLQKA